MPLYMFVYWYISLYGFITCLDIVVLFRPTIRTRCTHFGMMFKWCFFFLPKQILYHTCIHSWYETRTTTNRTEALIYAIRWHRFSILQTPNSRKAREQKQVMRRKRIRINIWREDIINKSWWENESMKIFRYGNTDTKRDQSLEAKTKSSCRGGDIGVIKARTASRQTNQTPAWKEPSKRVFWGAMFLCLTCVMVYVCSGQNQHITQPLLLDWVVPVAFDVKATRAASENASFTPLFIFAEHSIIV